MVESIGRLATTTREEIEKTISEEKTRGNDSPYDKRVGSGHFKAHPKYIYFYRIYLKDGRLGVDHYFWHQGNPKDTANEINALGPITPDGQPVPAGGISIRDALKKLAVDQQDWKKSDAADFEDPIGSGSMLWTIRSYVAFMIDDDAWDLLQLSDGKPAITFDPADKGKNGNHSFYDAFDLELKFGTLPRRTVCFINHMKKNRNGDDHMGNNDGDPRQDFKFNLFAWVKLVGWADTDADRDKKVLVVIDPVGGNEGPPEPP